MEKAGAVNEVPHILSYPVARKHCGEIGTDPLEM